MPRPSAMLRAGRPVAVLRVADQAAQRSPTMCVITGRPTVFATRTTVVALPGGVWLDLVLGHVLTTGIGRALRRPRTAVVLAADELAWKRWRGRLIRVIALCCAGLGLLLVGAVTGTDAFVGFGALLLVVGWIGRIRATLQSWVSISYRAETGHIRVFRAHGGFDAAARQLFVRAVDRDRRRP